MLRNSAKFQIDFRNSLNFQSQSLILIELQPESFPASLYLLHFCLPACTRGVPSDALPEGTGPTTDGPKEAEAQADGRLLAGRAIGWVRQCSWWVGSSCSVGFWVPQDLNKIDGHAMVVKARFEQEIQT